jgi:hypothetical protein
MARKLVMVALCGFGVAAVSGMIALVLRPAWHNNTPFGARLHVGFPLLGRFAYACADDGTNSQYVTRSLPWTDNSGKIELSLPATVNWTPGSGSSVTINGPAGAAGRVQIQGDKLSIDCMPKDLGVLTITLPGQAFSHYAIDKMGQLHLIGLDQPELDLDISGAATVEATGVVPLTRLDVSGAADINLSSLITQELHADLSGASNLTANPAQVADISLSGVGNVTLLTRPRHYHATISGIGHVNLPDESPAYQ